MTQAVGGTLAMFDWVRFPALRVASYIAAVDASYEGICAAYMGAYDQHISHVCIG